MDVWGFDISNEMVRAAKKNAETNGLDPGHIFWGDVQDPSTYEHCLKEGQFDGLMAMGVMPHIEDDEAVINNMAACIRPGGSLFIEFRNKLFSLFTFNRYTFQFILDDLLQDIDPKLKDLVRKDIEPRLNMHLPPVRDQLPDQEAPGYDAIPSRFHNPFEVQALFRRMNFRDIRLLWYHYHPGMPAIEAADPDLYRKEAFRLEREPSGWRALFLCSAFVVEAAK
jgi:SAM-dependent methyltransferase